MKGILSFLLVFVLATANCSQPNNNSNEDGDVQDDAEFDGDIDSDTGEDAPDSDTDEDSDGSEDADTPVDSDEPDGGEEVCTGLLSTWCEKHLNNECPDFDVQRSNLMQPHIQGWFGSYECVSEEGVRYYVLWMYESLSWVTTFYDPISFEIISAYLDDDVNVHCDETSFDIWWGEPISGCEIPESDHLLTQCLAPSAGEWNEKDCFDFRI